MGVYKLESRKPTMFEFEFEGKVYGVPAMDSLPSAVFMRIRRKLEESDNQAEMGFDEIMSLFESYVPDVMEKIDFGQAKELLVAYANTGVKLGE